MKRKAFYILEQRNLGENLILWLILALVLYVTGNTAYDRLIDPYSCDPVTFWIQIGILAGLWIIPIAWNLYSKHKKWKEFLEKRDIILTEGRMFDGEVIDTKEEVIRHHDPGDGTTYEYKYFAKVKFNNGYEDITYWTPELAFNPQRLTSEKVIVHMYRDEFYAHGFQIGKDIKEPLGKKIYAILFFTIWFGFLIHYDYMAFRKIQEGGLQSLLFSLIFWASGIYAAYCYFKK